MSRVGGAVAVLAIVVGACSSVLPDQGVASDSVPAPGDGGAATEAGTAAVMCTSAADCPGQVCCFMPVNGMITPTCEDACPITLVGQEPGGGGASDAGATCTSAAGCLPGQVCCGDANTSTNCQAGPCPFLQVCSLAAECFIPGATCGALTTAPSLPISVCGTPGSDGGSDAESGANCTPKTCAAYPAGTCGQPSDGCGGVTANCGTCTPPAFCGGGGPALCGGGPAVDAGEPACYHDLCVPHTCADFDCGEEGDGCGDLLECGPCPSSEACVNGQCIWPADAGPCVPATCEGLAYDCGFPSDGCGGHLECGTCPVSQFCGGGGVHRCGGVCDTPEGGNSCEVTCSSDDGGSCTGQSCHGGGYTCGDAPNGCGGLIDCGPCGADAGTSDAPVGG